LELVVQSGRDLIAELIGRLIKRLADANRDILESLLDVLLESVQTIKRFWEDKGGSGRSQSESQKRPHCGSKR
jgi:hypothetical protein